MRKNAVRRKYTGNQLIHAVANNKSFAGVLRSLGLKPAGANYSNVKHHIKELELDTSHWTGQGWSKGKTFNPKRDIVEYLLDNTSRQFPVIASSSLRKRLIKEGLKKSQCECCGIVEWNGKSAPLELDHINGNHWDNRIENIQILCPNCHAQTDTYRGRNRADRREKIERIRKEKEVKPPYDHNALKKDEVEERLKMISHIDLKKFGWVQKVADALNLTHTQARRFINKYYEGLVYTRKSPLK
jgi:hypothetical protein